MSLIDRTIKGGMWQSIAMVVHALLQVVVIAVLARLISPEEFGVFAIVSVLTAFVLFISEAGFGPSLIYQRTLTAGHVNAAFTSTIVLSFLFAIGLWISAPQLGIFFENEQVTAVTRWVCLSIPFTVFGTVSKSLLERELQFKRIMWANTISFAVGYALVAVVLAFFGLEQSSIYDKMILSPIGVVKGCSKQIESAEWVPAELQCQGLQGQDHEQS